MRHRVSIHDLSILLLVMLFAAYLAFEIDVFQNEGQVSPVEQAIELDEALLLGGVFTFGLLLFSIRRFMAQKREVTRRIAAEREARSLAYQDPLTGLANRRQFEEALAVAIGSPPSAGSLHVLLMLDLNGFKRINDTYGHGIGDALLIVVGQRLLRAVRDGDLVARLGGDEFAIIAKNLTSLDTASAIASRIIQEFTPPVIIEGVRHEVGAGIGMAAMPSDASTDVELLRRADLALYRAKGEKRSAYRFFEEDMDMLAREREQLERMLRQALDDDQIKPRYQPSFDLATGEVIGFEAVAGFDFAGDNVDPSRLVAIAEEIGLVHEIGKRILTAACVTAKQWDADISLSFDLLPGQIKDKELAQTILDIASAAGIDRQRLEIGVSESVVVQDLEVARRILKPLREAGISIAMANFGTGYSNLYHLQALGLDKVKIDRRFVDELGSDGAAKIVRALAGLGQGLGLIVSAEGMEYPETNGDLKTSGIGEFHRIGNAITDTEATYMVTRTAGFQRNALPPMAG